MGARHAWPELDPSEQFENRPDKSGRQPAFMQPRPARHESDLGGVALKPQQLVAELLELFALRLKGAPQLLLPLAALLVQVTPKFRIRRSQPPGLASAEVSQCGH